MTGSIVKRGHRQHLATTPARAWELLSSSSSDYPQSKTERRDPALHQMPVSPSNLGGGKNKYIAYNFSGHVKSHLSVSLSFSIPLGSAGVETSSRRDAEGKWGERSSGWVSLQLSLRTASICRIRHFIRQIPQKLSQHN